MNLEDLKDSLRENFRRESELLFGLKDTDWIERATNNWFDDRRNYDGRWGVIAERIPKVRRVLDMAAGCGTFLLFGLHKGHDVWGVEPEQWKQQYFRQKVLVSDYPSWYLDRFITAVGESLPFRSNSFHLVTTYQTLEHVGDVDRCIQEMLRVLKPGGNLYLRAPDYNSFFEPHYRVPFLPRMRKDVASLYLRLIGKPTQGLQTLQWITARNIIASLESSPHNLGIEPTTDRSAMQQEWLRERIPALCGKERTWRFLHSLYKLGIALTRIGRRESNIDLWVTKLG
jgi:ubiquinone/menaquinone biosynthesis C-methylase UbiE